MDPQPFDVVIVGAGPGGLSCASHLAGSGLRVLVLEKNDRLGKKICSGEISSKVKTPAGFDRGHAWTEIHVGTDETKTVVKLPRPYLHTVGRFEIESHLESHCGAAVRFSEPVIGIAPGYVETAKGRYAYRHLVGADGSFSVVRKHLGLPSENISGWAFHCVLERPCTEFHMYWLPKTLPGSYGYMMSKNRDKTMVGMAWRGEFDHALAARAKVWVGRTFGIDASKLKTEAMRGNADYRGWDFGNIYLVGDAGGFLNPLTTEGIAFAMKSGEGVARHIRGDPEGRRIMKRMADAHIWQVRLFRLFTNPRLPFCWMLEWVLKNPNGKVRRKLFDWVFWNLIDG
ncbi:NAD(P)/FAD-dependent oxidoreductase [Candidatus Micrarchaeota archaeon]|nr:NAD(P)/FAD-dependent oxidoreductase [Candidatus Micrarchaeota archaeon]